MGQQLGVIAGTAELDGVEFGYFIKINEFVIGLDPGLVGLGRQDPLDVAGDPGRVKISQHADPLVALLDIEIAQIFIAEDGVGNAHVAQMGRAQVDPFGGKLGLLVQQRLERRGKGRDAACRLGTHDPLGRDLHQAHIHYDIRGILRQDLVQHRGMGTFLRHQQFPVFLLALAQRLGIFFSCCLYCHGSLLRKGNFSHII